MMFIHEIPEAKQLFTLVANEKDVDPYLDPRNVLVKKNKNLFIC